MIFVWFWMEKEKFNIHWWDTWRTSSSGYVWRKPLELLIKWERKKERDDWKRERKRQKVREEEIKCPQIKHYEYMESVFYYSVQLEKNPQPSKLFNEYQQEFELWTFRREFDPLTWNGKVFKLVVVEKSKIKVLPWNPHFEAEIKILISTLKKKSELFSILIV
jgi:hypothetical protein